jgi:hypothetical protein
MQWRFRIRRRLTDGYNQARAEIIEFLGRDNDNAADFYHFGMYEPRLEIADQHLAGIGVEIDSHRDGMY